MPNPWLAFCHRMALSAWIASLSVAELWASLAAEAAAAAFQSLPDHHRVTLRLVVNHGHRLDCPEEFHR